MPPFAKRSQKLLRRFLFILLFLFSSLNVQAGEELVLKAPQIYQFALTLMKQGEYYRAITEWKRLIHFFPESPQAAVAKVKIGRALILGGKPGEGVAHLKPLAEGSGGDSARYLLALGYLEQGKNRPYPLRTDSLSHAFASLREISENWPGKKPVGGFLKAMEAPPSLPEKSPFLAGSLSAVLPGAGSFYTGRVAEGALALFLNAAMIYSTAEAVKKERRTLGAFLGTFALAFYGGSIYAAANGAHKFNSDAKAAYLKQQRAKFGLIPQRGGLAGVFQGRF